MRMVKTILVIALSIEIILMFSLNVMSANDIIVDSKIRELIGKDDITDEEEIRMVAQLIESEAGIEDYIGKCLVADVVFNRVDSDIYPDTIEEVIQDRFPCVQFSSVSIFDGGFERAKDNISEESLMAAQHEYMNWKTGDNSMLCEDIELLQLEASDIHGDIDRNILFYTEGEYNPYCKPAYKYGRHYFGY